MNYFFPVFIIASVLVVVVYIYLWYLPRKKRRTEGLANNAARLGFTFEGDISVKPKEKFAPLRLFCIHPPGMMENFQNNTMCFAMKTQKTWMEF